MPIFLAALIGALASSAGTIVGRVLLSLGVGYVAYQGVDTSIGWAKDFLLQQLAGMPSRSLQVAGLLQIGRCVSILTSALVARMAFNGMKSGVMKKLTLK